MNEFHEFKLTGKLVSEYPKKGAMVYVYAVSGSPANLAAYREMQEGTGYLRHQNGDEKLPMLAFSKQTMGQETVEVRFRANSTGPSFRGIKHLELQRRISEFTTSPELRASLADKAADRILGDIMGDIPAPVPSSPALDAEGNLPEEQVEPPEEVETDAVEDTASELTEAGQDD